MSFNVEEKWWKIDGLWCIYRYLMKTKNLGTSRTGFSKFFTKSVPWLSVTPSVMGINTWSTSQVDFSTHSRYMDKVYWCPTNLGKVRTNFPLEWICNTPVPFDNNFPQNSIFWWFKQGNGESSWFKAFELSGAMSRCGKMTETWFEVV